MKTRLFIAIRACLLLALTGWSLASAAEPPPELRELLQTHAVAYAYRDVFLFDHAGIFSLEEANEMQQFCVANQEHYGTPTVVVTFPGSSESVGTDDDIVELAVQFHQAIAAEDKTGVFKRRGVLIVASQRWSLFGITLGDQWRRVDRQAFRGLLDSHFRPAMKQGHAKAAILLALNRSKEFAKNRNASYRSYYWDVQKRTLTMTWDTLSKPTWTNKTYWTFGVLLVFFVWEWIRPWRQSQRRFRKGLALDVFYTVFSYLLFWTFFGTALCWTTSKAFDDLLFQQFHIENLLAINLATMPTWVRYLGVLLMGEFLGYWIHRMLHRFDWAWEFHKIHHSATRLDVMNAARLHFGERLIYQFFSYLPLALIGFAVEDVFWVFLFTTLFSNFTHANVWVSLGPLKYVLNSPQMHLWHHTADIRERGNVNYGDALSLWDFVFRTAYESDDTSGEANLGFDGIESYPQSFLKQTFLPFQDNFRRLIRLFNRRGHS